MDAIRQRFITDRVLTASPAQRVVMLYDRLLLDLVRAADVQTDPSAVDGHLEHASLVVAELAGSLDQSAGGPAENLASLYGWMLGRLTTARLRPGSVDLAPLETSVRGLREAWVAVARETATAASTAAGRAVTAFAGLDAPSAATAWTA